MYSLIPPLIAIIAPTVSCVQLLPQLVKTSITKKTKDLSFGSLILILISNMLWLVHGYLILDISLIAAGSISMTINSVLLFLYMKYV
jgi:uncharacterized protein with PQ loop repeat